MSSLSALLQRKEERTSSAPLPGALQLPTVREADKGVLRAQSEPDRGRAPSLSSAASAAQPQLNGLPGALPVPVQSQGSSGRAQQGSSSQAQSQMVRLAPQLAATLLGNALHVSPQVLQV